MKAELTRVERQLAEVKWRWKISNRHRIVAMSVSRESHELRIYQV